MKKFIHYVVSVVQQLLIACLLLFFMITFMNIMYPQIIEHLNEMNLDKKMYDQYLMLFASLTTILVGSPVVSVLNKFSDTLFKPLATLFKKRGATS